MLMVLSEILLVRGVSSRDDDDVSSHDDGVSSRDDDVSCGGGVFSRGVSCGGGVF